jgi:hypothetical protein
MSTFTIAPIDEPTARAIRAEIESGQRTGRRVTLDEGGAPCRSCLRPAAVGESLWLLSFQPFRGDSCYAVPSPIYLHVEPCRPYEATDRLPDLVRIGLRAVRSYDEHHDLVDGLVGDGTDVETLIDKLLADPRASYLHVHSATAGCYTCRVDRGS